MSTKQEIMDLENQLREAELGPDPEFFQRALADDAILDGQALKQKVVDAHRPGKGPKFSKVVMSDFEIIDHGNAAVVLCKGYYEGPQWTGTLNFMRVWLKKGDRWQIVAGTTKSD
jgi:hypothetical protein